MHNFYKIFPVFALATALTPLAAHARSFQSPAPQAQQYLVAAQNATPPAPHGRATQSDVPAGQIITSVAPQYAANDADDTFSG